jgi:hypothetical protein
MKLPITDPHVLLVHKVHGERGGWNLLIREILNCHFGNKDGLSSIRIHRTEFFEGQLEGRLVRRPHPDNGRLVLGLETSRKDADGKEQ